jgi:hypothetical protein
LLTGAWFLASAAELGAAKARAISKKPQANVASALILLECLISSSIQTPPAIGLAERRLG